MQKKNSPQYRKSFFELMTEKYNDASWVPTSKAFVGYDEKLATSIQLPLEGEPLTVEQATRHFKNAKGQMNIALANWRKSGNGAGNLAPKIKGIDYAASASTDKNTHTSSSSSSAASNDRYVDDDCADFVNHTHIGYYWSLAELYDLVDVVSQSCSKAGVSTGDSSTILSVSEIARGREKRRKKETSVSESQAEMMNFCSSLMEKQY